MIAFHTTSPLPASWIYLEAAWHRRALSQQEGANCLESTVWSSNRIAYKKTPFLDDSHLKHIFRRTSPDILIINWGVPIMWRMNRAQERILCHCEQCFKMAGRMNSRGLMIVALYFELHRQALLDATRTLQTVWVTRRNGSSRVEPLNGKGMWVSNGTSLEI